jgi:Transglycosylase
MRRLCGGSRFRMPEVLRDAVIALEDERFWEHKGVDLRAALRALTSNASAGEVAQGASTITMQIVKNTLTGADDGRPGSDDAPPPAPPAVVEVPDVVGARERGPRPVRAAWSASGRPVARRCAGDRR